jgi:hypothetical protein
MMNFLLEHLQIVFIVVALIVTGFSKLREFIAKTQPEEPDWKPVGSGADDGYAPVEEYQAPVRRRAQVPPPLTSYVAPAAAEPELERQRNMQQRLKALRDSKAAATPVKPAIGKGKPKMKPAAPPLISPSSLRSRLRDRKEIRRAIVLREILGPPVGLK